jgi:ParB/RepB/Spo0J family partition protein
LASLAAGGQQTAIVVVALAGQTDRYLVIDGYQRIAALQQLGRDTVEAVVWPMTEAEAVMLDRSLHWGQRETPLEEGWLLAEMERRFGYGLDELARRFDRSVSWVSRRLALVEQLPESVQQQVRSGEITAHAAMKFLAPVARVSVEDCQRLATAFARQKCNTRQAGQLYAAWRQASPASRQRILDQPQLFLKAQRQSGLDPPEAGGAPPGAALLRELKTVVAIASRASRRLAGGVEMDGGQCEEARRQIDHAIDQLSRLAAKIPRKEKEQAHVEPKSTHSNSGTARPGSAHPPDCAAAGNLPSDGAKSPAVEVCQRAGDRARRESRTLPAADPGTVTHLQRESRAGP